MIKSEENGRIHIAHHQHFGQSFAVFFFLSRWCKFGVRVISSQPVAGAVAVTATATDSLNRPCEKWLYRKALVL